MGSRDPIDTDVSPAYAGIDPRPVRRNRSGCSFPRIRGDRPRARTQGMGEALFPPHTRGSTGETRPLDTHPPVSPAYAGIDPFGRMSSLICTRFPRIRGDRPVADRALADASRFPPHTRGSTVGVSAVGACALVSPAYAGIDRRRSTQSTSQRSFPRIRGDRPDPELFGIIYTMFPPHTRGSTGDPREGLTITHVSPAYAGIDPADAGQARPPYRFPRIRGDRPGAGAGGSDRMVFPPHTRGSTMYWNSAP